MERILTAAEDIDVVFHVAAFKYVPEGEYNPFEVVQTNVIGTQNMISVALKTPSITHFVMVSTDKAVQPTSTMGASKLLAERLVSAAHYIKGKKQKVFAVVRFGNVLGSSGSVLPIFIEQIKHGKVMITHPEMTRFFMTISDAAGLLFKATTLARGGEVFISKMPAVRIQDLAEACIAKFATSPVPITYGTIRPGEKLHEMLLTTDEARQALETDSLFIVVPQIEIGDITFADYHYPGASPVKDQSYSTESAPLLQPSEIQALLSRVV
jgi:FlaA1/EpsC-like NDP-sugar epimerase